MFANFCFNRWPVVSINFSCPLLQESRCCVTLFAGLWAGCEYLTTLASYVLVETFCNILCFFLYNKSKTTSLNISIDVLITLSLVWLGMIFARFIATSLINPSGILSEIGPCMILTSVIILAHLDSLLSLLY